MKRTILIADDEKHIRSGLSLAIGMEGYQCFEAENGKEAWKIINDNSIDMVITDLKMPVMSGQELLRKISGSFPNMPVVVLTGHGTVEDAVEAMRNGAVDFISKPVNIDHLLVLVNKSLKNKDIVDRNKELSDEVQSLKKRVRYDRMIGKSQKVLRLLDLIQQVAPTKATVLVTGESGVGKELVADSLVNFSDRADKPFIKVHCAALSQNLLESELFGHEKGSFTGAIARKQGRFELADGGTIFLDEIGEIDQSTQVKLLRVLQEREFERVGGEKTIKVDVRIIAATNRNLEEEIKKGNFREDLYYRLNVVHIHVPPLRERKDDIPIMITSFLQEFAKENDKKIEGIDNRTRSALYKYDWPGNIRQLRNCIESAVVMCSGNVITLDDLPPGIVKDSDTNAISIPTGITMSEAEKILIAENLAINKGNKSKTAEVLGIGRKTLHRKIDEYNIE